MSLSLNLNQIAVRVVGILPRIPEIHIAIPNIFQRRTEASTETHDPRILELIENLQDAEVPPFFIDNGILKAAPKKKVSHMKRRQKLYGPGKKQLSLLQNLNRCPACGNYKRSHTLCMHCVGQIRRHWNDSVPQQEAFREEFVNPLDEKILYPGKKELPDERTLRKKEWLKRRPRTLPVE
ncbi:54S ribosomal protein L32, mitochondrial [Komagataella phaffii CBS 7435]|uniref:Large ribosomal subunit protein bL32m n=3 Tax=Komagataella TaxID=460517 RepID=C4R939_KOMPG|nr:mitochondrial 54S ribosomal protein YmL32 [Komagataella phaffii GS115]AOA64760.1 GQ67_05238T0 [Komagataella phaffii]CAH2450475.1 54S ribosomal protein L32, mitochondrial [Komagataella phaffii CBS 7435]AOA70273.1 GQ68_05220T0 [Komagataella phaffii GS115]CAY72114.1 Mitochondrial ribosomal protein of the large subunit [Komagataella phaffii GS115]CCA40282.1 54S ribosomal protein L32, mitochondrial [Komagataella phaffii CBS 7435]